MLCVRSAGARVHDNIVHVSPREDFFPEGDGEVKSAGDGDARRGSTLSTLSTLSTKSDKEAAAAVEDGGGGNNNNDKKVEEVESANTNDDEKYFVAPPYVSGEKEGDAKQAAVASELRDAHAAAAELPNPAATGGLAEDMKDEDIDTLSQYVRIRHFAPGKEVISEGQVGCAVLFITVGLCTLNQVDP
jgi:hypothetical protein